MSSTWFTWIYHVGFLGAGYGTWKNGDRRHAWSAGSICVYIDLFLAEHSFDGILAKDLPCRLLTKGLLKMMFVCVFLQVIHPRSRYQALRTITHFHTFPGFFPTPFLNKLDNYLFVFGCVLFPFLHTYIYIIIQHAHNHTHTDLWNQDLRLFTYRENVIQKSHETSSTGTSADSALWFRFEAESCQADCLESGMGRVCFEPVPWLGGGFNSVGFSSRTLGKWSNLTK